MPSNVEIKARVRDVARLQRLAEQAASGPPAVLEQEDTFFNVPAGRLKLRDFGDGRGELISYRRPDDDGPMQSEYFIAAVANPAALRRALAAALGVRGVVRKTRLLYLAGRTRIHIDHVQGLGDFMELEVVLAEGEDPQAARREADDLMARLQIAPADLIGCAYIDLLEQA
ncbi:MAG: hypothetical protein BIFFINMI_02494 [Phycisphaerae bacterium]|nr:hypothetical protein [Phycisphaerae bacterium]